MAAKTRSGHTQAWKANDRCSLVTCRSRNVAHVTVLKRLFRPRGDPGVLEPAVLGGECRVRQRGVPMAQCLAGCIAAAAARTRNARSCAADTRRGDCSARRRPPRLSAEQGADGPPVPLARRKDAFDSSALNSGTAKEVFKIDRDTPPWFGYIAPADMHKTVCS